MKIGALQDMEYATLVRVPNGPERSKLMSKVLATEESALVRREDTENAGLHVRLGLEKLCLDGGIMLSNTPDIVPSEVSTGHLPCQK